MATRRTGALSKIKASSDGPSRYDLPPERPRGKAAGALYDLVMWATGGNKSMNPYGYREVKAAREALGAGPYDLPARRPSGAITGPLYDLSAWSTGSNKSGNPYMHREVGNAIEALNRAARRVANR
jgi:hypothetical protein